MDIWDEFDKSIDTKGLQEDINEVANSEFGDYKEVPHGDYEIEIEKLELGKSKKGDPKLIVWFNILAGDFEGQKIFYNQVLTSGFGVHNANEFLRSLDTAHDVKFETFTSYNNLICGIKSQIEKDKLEYLLEYGENKKGYNTFKIKEVFGDD